MSSQPPPPPPLKHHSSITRYYIDTRPLVSSSPKSLPLLSTLQITDQESVTRFIRPADRFMSLASALLKYTFIHRRAGIPWSDIHISRTPAPHKRPYWEPPDLWTGPNPSDSSAPSSSDTKSDIKGLEFNVSHQAGLVAIMGCTTPTAQLPNPSPSISSATPLSPSLPTQQLKQLNLDGHHSPVPIAGQVRLGVDIACTNEDKRTPKDLNTQAKFEEWVDIFAEMFSDRERRIMMHAPVHVPVAEREEGDYGWDSSTSSEDGKNMLLTGGGKDAKIIEQKLRRFYAYWGLKEAYIKMVGEGLLASWLRELEFLDVVPPAVPEAVSRARSRSRSRNRVGGMNVPNVQANNHSHLHPQAGLQHEVEKWTPPEKAERGVTTLFRGKKVEDVDIELVAYDEDFLVATAMRGVEEVEDGMQAKKWVRLDIENDIRPCAEGKCDCFQ
ncbi:hypothetical protein LTR99_006560 [Exophiala xenobiotica]|uniref:holo-[acyl-carrier-protein] synthase n=1 Tax=Vermiconidia calcicola TaxID=1690605 RepID=A0AAV9QAV1_9PEZI|nr:hypothetical protein LTR72_008240 [Exophiala xenobiotica]KAK5535668.1 hypothetical protein LTR23_008262 [Chaetothyriales sp. CCFEE 6169]KAK5537730.1 hypothetical protein LTR25_004982 [Vermiconidia calcicola]KAK5267373.1 hypothetical protein LTR96_007406 [Exophiala xenobiotica]KAK5291391.1 hypothetical protein LTR14_005965 [Exophiala xenobiotica]